jgi:hypothetical protein
MHLESKFGMMATTTIAMDTTTTTKTITKIITKMVVVAEVKRTTNLMPDSKFSPLATVIEANRETDFAHHNKMHHGNSNFDIPTHLHTLQFFIIHFIISIFQY